MKKTNWIVAGVVGFIMLVGLGIMFSGPKENKVTIRVPDTEQINIVEFDSDTVIIDTIHYN